MKELAAGITFCVTHDLQATARFYEDVLGLPLVLDQGKCRVHRVAGRAFSLFPGEHLSRDRNSGS